MPPGTVVHRRQRNAPLAGLREATPQEIVRELDRYIVGQRAAKRCVAIALRNRYRRRLVAAGMRDEIVPNNIIMIGPTGVGKTEIARRLARLSHAPFLKVEATKFTEVGYVGRDVDTIIRDLVEIAINMVREEMSAQVHARARRSVERRLLELLLPPAPRRHAREPAPGMPSLFGAEDALCAAATAGDAQDARCRRERMRERLRQQLREGLIEDRVIELDIEPRPSLPTLELLAHAGLDDMEFQLPEPLQPLAASGTQRRKLTIAEARRRLMQAETGKLIDMEKVVATALERAQSSGIVFIDEIDKIAFPSGGAGPDVSRRGVQRDLLPIIEGSGVATRYGLVKTDHILFIAAGAFHANRPADLLPELQGRFPIRVELSPLTEADFVRILTEPENALLKQYTALMQTEEVTLRFTEGAIRRIAAIATRVNEQTENIGARRLHTILTTLLEEVLFEVPEARLREVLVDEALVERRLHDILEDTDLSRYIL
jgi:ATP-dependent HslUV protease ATP-binding subunit HslU